MGILSSWGHHQHDLVVFICCELWLTCKNKSNKLADLSPRFELDVVESSTSSQARACLSRSYLGLGQKVRAKYSWI